MKTTPSQASAAAAASELQQRLHVLISVALRNSVAALDGFTRRLGSALTEASLHAQDSAAATTLQQAAEHLSRERTSYQRLFSNRLQQALEQEAQTLLARPKTRLRNDALDLSLGSFDAMQRKVVIDNYAQAFDRSNAALLDVVQLRLAHWLGRDGAGLRNPFRAEVFLHAAVDAWERFDPAPAAQAVLLQQLAPGSFLPLDTILAALDQELSGRRVLPEADLHYGRRAQRRSAPGLGLLQAERRVLAHGGEAFDLALAHLQRSASLPPHTLSLLTMLQPPLRALADADDRFLLSPRHGGRRLVQQTIQASLAGGAATKDGAALTVLVKRLAVELTQDRSSPALDAAGKQIEAHLAPLLQAVAQKRDECIAEATRQEREARAEQQARTEVMARIEDGGVPVFIESFLLEHWTRVLAFARNVHAGKPALLPNLVQAMDDLIWSVAAKPRESDRAELTERLPALLALLNAWLNVVKWDGPPRLAFFERLSERHAELLRGAPKPGARDLLQERMDIAQRASEHDLRRRSDEAEEDALVPYMHHIDALVPGDWAEFVRNDGTSVQCRLAWVSAARSRFVLIAPSAQMAFVISEQLFAESLRAGRTRITATGEVLQAALAVAAAELGIDQPQSD